MNEIISLFRLEHPAQQKAAAVLCTRLVWLPVHTYVPKMFVPLPQMNARMSRTPLSRRERTRRKAHTKAGQGQLLNCLPTANNTTGYCTFFSPKTQVHPRKQALSSTYRAVQNQMGEKKALGEKKGFYVLQGSTTPKIHPKHPMGEKKATHNTTTQPPLL
jgi:hypothetical protein